MLYEGKKIKVRMKIKRKRINSVVLSVALVNPENISIRSIDTVQINRTGLKTKSFGFLKKRVVIPIIYIFTYWTPVYKGIMNTMEAIVKFISFIIKNITGKATSK